MPRTKRTAEWQTYLPDKLREDIAKLPKGLLDHCIRASEVARQLAERFGYDPDKAQATAMAHDITRAMNDHELRQSAKRLRLALTDLEGSFPILVHGQAGAEILRQDYGLTDQEMLDAIACHTTGRRGMGLLDKILFLADKIEPEKAHFKPKLAEVKDLAESNLDHAILKFFDLQLTDLIAKGLPIHPTMVEARNELLDPQGPRADP